MQEDVTQGITVEHQRQDSSCFFQLHYDGKPVSRLWVHDIPIRVGEALLRMGGIGGVETDEAYRGRGFARRLLEAANEYMRENGFDLGGLFGIPNFYERWGYAPALPEYRLTVTQRNLEGAQLRHFVANYTEQHQLEVLRIYTDNNRDRFCSVVRQPERWKGFSMGAGWWVKADVKVFLNERGEVSGYLSLDDTVERTNVAEVGYATPSVFESMVAFLRERAKENGHEEITLHLPPDHLFAIYLRRYGCVATQQFLRSGEGMMRIICLESLMQKMQKELTRRLQTSPLSAQSVTFAIVTDIGTVTIAISNGQVSIVPNEVRNTPTVELPQERLTQLLTGYQTIDALCADPTVRCDERLLPWLRVLFPSAYPYIWWADRF